MIAPLLVMFSIGPISKDPKIAPIGIDPDIIELNKSSFGITNLVIIPVLSVRHCCEYVEVWKSVSQFKKSYWCSKCNTHNEFIVDLLFHL